MGDSISNTHCVSEDMYVSASTGNNDERQHVQYSKAHVCLRTCICLSWCPAVLFSCGRLLHDMPDPLTLQLLSKMVPSVLKDSGLMVQRSYIFCVLNALPACAMILHLLHKSWPITCGIIWHLLRS